MGNNNKNEMSITFKSQRLSHMINGTEMGVVTWRSTIRGITFLVELVVER
jgi:hypothetical protein